MRFDPEVPGRRPVVTIAAASRSALWCMTVVVLIAAFGCASGRAKKKTADTQPVADSSTSTSASGKSGTQAGGSAAHHDASVAGASNHVRLTEHGCIQFEPHWSSIHVGQTLVWDSKLKSPVTIHVSPGAFEKAEYVVRPGATLSTGPARAAGSYSIWSDPAACQGAPIGAHGSEPGVTVEAAATRK